MHQPSRVDQQVPYPQRAEPHGSGLTEGTESERTHPNPSQSRYAVSESVSERVRESGRQESQGARGGSTRHPLNPARAYGVEQARQDGQAHWQNEKPPPNHQSNRRNPQEHHTAQAKFRSEVNENKKLFKSPDGGHAMSKFSHFEGDEEGRGRASEASERQGEPLINHRERRQAPEEPHTTRDRLTNEVGETKKSVKSPFTNETLPKFSHFAGDGEVRRARRQGVDLHTTP